MLKSVCFVHFPALFDPQLKKKADDTTASLPFLFLRRFLMQRCFYGWLLHFLFGALSPQVEPRSPAGSRDIGTTVFLAPRVKHQRIADRPFSKRNLFLQVQRVFVEKKRFLGPISKELRSNAVKPGPTTQAKTHSR